MKKQPILSKSISSLLLIGAIGALPQAQAGNTWTGGGASTNWSDNNNWGGAQPAYGTLTFTTGGTQGTTSIVNQAYSMNQLLWTGSSSWILNNSGGFGISLFDNGGVQAKIENQSTGLVTINAPITFAATTGAAWGEINAVNGDLLFGSGTLTVNGSGVNGIRMFGAGHTTTFNNTVSATGKYFSTSAVGTTIAIGGSFTASDLYIMNTGVLNLNAGSTLNANVRLGGDFATTGTQDLTKSGTFNLTPAAGGLTFANVVNSVANNTSAALAVNSNNTSGTNTLSGHVALDSALKIAQAASGTLSITQAHTDGATAATGTDIKGQTLTLTPASGGTISISGDIYNSTGSGGVTMNGAGTLTLSGTNTYGGTTTLATGGTLNINSTTALGTGTLALSGSATIDNTSAAAITLANNNPLTLSGGSLTFTGTKDLNLGTGAVTLVSLGRTITTTAGTLTLGGTISGATFGLTKAGAGTLVLNGSLATTTGTLDVSAGTLTLAGANNYSGATTLSAGTINVNSTTAFGTSSSIAMNGVTLDNTSGSAKTLANNNAFTLGGNNIFTGTNDLNLGTGAMSLNGATRTWTINGGTLTVGGNLTGGSAAIGLTKAGVGTLKLAGAANSTIGTLTINAGTVDLGTDLGLSGGTIVGGSGGTINTSGGRIVLNVAGGDFGVANGGTLTVNAVIADGTQTAIDFWNTSSGTGIVVLNAANTFSGVTNLQSGVITVSTIGSSGSAGNLGKNGTFHIGTATSTATLKYTGTGETNDRVLDLAGTTGGATLDQSGTGLLKFTSNLTATGAGTKTLTLQGSTAGTGELAGAIVGNTITNLTKQGTGAWTLSSASNAITGNVTVAGGALSVSGALGTNTTSGNFRVGTVAGTKAILNILPGAVINNRLNLFVGDAGSGTGGGAVYQSGGSLTLTQAASVDDLRIGSNAGGYGYYKLSGGTLTLNEIGIGGSLAGTVGVFEMTGGTLADAGWISIGRGTTTSSGLLNASGGTISALRIDANGAGTAGAISVLNIGGGAGAASVSTTGSTTLGVSLASANIAGTIGIANLLTNGTLTTGIVNAGATGTGVNPTAILNFNGGTLKATATNAGTTFLTSANIDNVYVYGNGGTIDNNATAITISKPLLAPTDSGVTTIAVTAGGSGYIGAPLLTITGGTGTGATANANMVDDGTGAGTFKIGSITITSAGVYTVAPTTVTASGGAATTAATIGAITTAANSSGGMTFAGSGTTTLSGASTFSGNIAVNAGTLSANFTNIGNPLTGALGNETIAGRTVTVAAGATLRLNVNDIFGNGLAVAANLPSLIVSGAMTTLRYNQIGALTLNGATLTSANIIDSGNYQNFQFLGDVTVGGSAPSFISSTGAANFDGNHLFTNTTFNVADATGSAATDLTVTTPLRNQSGNYALAAGGFTKTGAGKMELTGTSSYTGATGVTNGTLLLSGTGAINSSSGLTVNGAGAKFVQDSTVAVTPTVTLTQGAIDGTGTINTVNAAAGTTIANGDGGTGALTIGTLTHGGAATYNLTTASALPVLAVGTLTTGGGIITINASNASWTTGLDYDLISYTTLTGALADFTKGTVANLGARQSATLTNPAGFIALTIGGDLPVWTGLQSGSWTTNIIGGTSNWKLQTGATATDFITSDTVLFDDTITTGTTAVAINVADVNPISTTFNNTANNYTVTGGFGIASGTLIKNGTASVTLGTANTYTGPTAINAGTFNLTGSLGNTAVTVANGATLSLQAAGAISQNTVTVSGTITQNTNNALSGTAALVLNSGATLGNANTYSGGTTLNAGTLNINQATAIGTGRLTLNGGTLDTPSGSLTLTNNNVQTWGSGASVAFTGTNSLNLGTGAVTLGADASAGSFTLTNNSALSGTSLTVGGAVTAGTGGAAGLKTLNIAGAGSTALTGNVTTGTATGLILNDTSSNTLTLSGAASSITTLNINGGAGSIVDLGAGSLTVSNGGASIVQSTTGGTINGSGASAIALGSNAGDFGTAGGTTLTVNAKISGANGVDFYNANGGSGFGTIALTAANTWTGATNVENTKVVLTGSINAANTANIGQITVGDIAATNALLVVSGGAINATKTSIPSLAVGSVAGAVGAINMTSGTITTTSEFHLGRSLGAYAAFTMSGGTVNSGNWLVVGGNNDRAVLNQSGGAINVTANRLTIGAGGAGSIGVVNQSGGTFTSAAGANTGIFVGENGTGTYTLSGTGAITLNTTGAVNSGTLQFAGNATSLAGNFNLNGGTLTAFGVTKGASTVGGVYAFNFNGGTLKANAANAAFFAALANTSTYVNGAFGAFSGGGTIDDGGFAVTVAQPLLAPTGSGVSSIAVTGGAGYLDPPLVLISGGGGTGATAIANLDGSGNLTGITMTNPGVNYASAPTVTLSGGGGTGAVIGAVGTTANTSGGLTKQGTGTLTLSGASTYTGGTQLNAGTIAAANNTALGTGAVTIASGATRLIVNDGITLANAITINGGNPGIVTGLIQGSGTGTSTLNGPITINGLTTSGGHFAGGGGTLVVNGAITSSVPVTVRVGNTVFSGGGSYTAINLTDLPKIGANNGLSTSAVAEIAPSGPATFDLNGFNQELAGVTRLTGNSATVTNTSGTASTLNLNVSGANSYAYSGVLAGNLALTKSGTGTETLSGVNTYSGLTTVSNGTLALSGGAAIADAGAVSLANVAGATLLLNASETIGSLAGGGVLGGTVSLGANTLTTGDAGTTTFAGVLSGAGGQVIKQGAGTFNITGAQTYAGLTTTGGVTNIYTALGTGTSTLTANATTHIYASQTLASLTIGSGTTVTFGDGLPFAPAAEKFGAPAALVPEPGTLGLLLLGALGLTQRRRRTA